MIAKVIAMIVHEVVKAYRELDGDDDHEGLPDHLKVSVTSLITEVLEKKAKEEESRHTPSLGFGADIGRGNPKGTKN